jgi:hypothetical protein
MFYGDWTQINWGDYREKIKKNSKNFKKIKKI